MRRNKKGINTIEQMSTPFDDFNALHSLVLLYEIIASKSKMIVSSVGRDVLFFYL